MLQGESAGAFYCGENEPGVTQTQTRHQIVSLGMGCMVNIRIMIWIPQWICLEYQRG